MSYIGNQPTVGQYRKLDDISGSFNGSLTAFTMQVSSTNVTAGSAFQLLISLGGVIQEPGTDFTVSGSTITFTTAPAASLSFFGIMMGQPLNTATPGDSTVTGAKIVDGTITGGKLAAAFNYDSGLLFLDDTNNRVGVGTASASGKLHVSSGSSSGLVSADADDLIVENNGNCGITIASPNSGTGSIRFTDPQDNDSGVISYNHNDESLRFSAFATERARFDSLGRFLIGETATAGTLDAMLQVGGGNGSTTFSGVAIISGNDEVAGHIMLDSSASNSVAFAADPDDLRASTNMRFTVDGTEAMRIHESGKITVRTTNVTNGAELTLSAPLNSGDPTLNCTVGLTAGTVDTVMFRDNSGHSCGVITVNASTNTTNYGTSSDYRLKENVVPLTGAIERLNQLQVKRFNFISEPEIVFDGFLAHEAQEVVPECATHSKDAVDAEGNPIYQNIDQSKLVPLLTAALQEAIDKIGTLEARLTALEGSTP